MKRDLNDVSDGVVDLHPTNWESSRPKQPEPFFDKGWPGALAYFVGLAVTLTAIHYFR